MKKIENALIRAFLRARAEMLRLENEEDGMETVETVILVAVAVVVAGAIIVALTGKNHEGGIIKDLFDTFKTKIEDLFNPK